MSKNKNDNNQQYPDHRSHITSVNRVIGQLDGIKKMMLDRKYCPDIIQQIRAARGGLLRAEIDILSVHMHNCVADAAKQNEEDDIKEKIEEIMKYLKTLIK